MWNFEVIPKLLILFIFISEFACHRILNIGIPRNNNNNRNTSDDESSLKNYATRSRSLTRLIYYISEEYFQGCDVMTYHDDRSDSHPSVVVRDFYENHPLVAFIKSNGDFTSLENSLFQMRDKCYNHMIFLDDIFHIEKVMKREIRNKVLIICESTPWVVKDFLRRYSTRFFVNLLVITHSTSRNSKDGSYLLYTHKLFPDGSGTSEPFLLTSWMNDSLSMPGTDLFPEKLVHGFNGHRILISAAHQPPFTIRKTNPGSGEPIWDGIDVRMIRLLGKTLNFTTEIRDVTSSTLSPVAAATHDVKHATASAAIGGIYRTSEIVKEFDSPMAHMQDCAVFISLASAALPKYRAVMGPFSVAVWVLLCAVYIIAIVPLTMNSRYNLRQLVTKPSYLNSMFWYVFSTFTNSFHVKNPLLKSGLGKNSTSILIGIYWVFTIIITSCYTGSIMAFITVPVYPPPMETVEQLVTNGYQVATLDHDGWETWFNYTNIADPLAQKLLMNLEYVPTVREGMRNASHAYFWPYAFLGSRTLLEYTMKTATEADSTKKQRSLMHISTECFVRYGVTILLPIQSIYTESFAKVIIRARQAGLAQKIVRDVDRDMAGQAGGNLLSASGKVRIQGSTGQERPLAIDDTQGIFMILGIGTVAGFIALFGECVGAHGSKYCKMGKIDNDSDDSNDRDKVYERNLTVWKNQHEDFSNRRFSSTSI